MAAKRNRVGNAFGLALAQARAQADISQEELGARAHYGQNYVSQVETGRRQPTISAILAFEAALELPTGELVRRTRENLPKGARRAK